MNKFEFEKKFKNIANKLNLKYKNINIYYEAFVHPSFANENKLDFHYERLEFLGDAVLEVIISDYLFNERHLEEGTMTKMRSCYVCEAACCTYAKELGLDKCILLGSGEVEANTTILADVFESFIGAMYLDQGLEFTKNIVINIISKYIERKVNFLHDYKSLLQEQVQNVRKSAIYEVIEETGPAHDKTFKCQVRIDNIIMGVGTGSSKKAAEQEAAKEALEKQIKV